MCIQNTVCWMDPIRSRNMWQGSRNSAAITDHGVMYGVIDFYKEAKAQGIKPILGCEVYVAPGSRFDKEAGNNEDRYYHLVLLAENNEGYQNLMKIVSRGFVYVRESEDLLEEAHSVVVNAVDDCMGRHVNDWGKIKNIIRDSLSDFLWKKMKRNPMILPIIMEV